MKLTHLIVIAAVFLIFLASLFVANKGVVNVGIKGHITCGNDVSYSTSTIELKDGVYLYKNMFGQKITAPSAICTVVYFN